MSGTSDGAPSRKSRQPAAVIVPNQTDGEWGWYLYGITRQTTPTGEAASSSEAASGFDGLPGLDDGEPIELLVRGELAAITSRVPLAEFGSEALRARIEDTVWLEKMVRGHERVVEAIHRIRTVLPAKFGCVYAGPEELCEALAGAEQAVLQQIDRLEGCDEWGIRLYAERESVQSLVARESLTVRQVREELQAARPGRAYFLRRQMADLLESETDQEMMVLAQACRDRLGRLALSSQLGKCEEARSASGETEILHAAFLVRRTEATVFQEEVRKCIDGREGLRCQYSGPWPPYSFAAPIENPEVDRSSHLPTESRARGTAG